jgi:hypothetical protein
MNIEIFVKIILILIAIIIIIYYEKIFSSFKINNKEQLEAFITVQEFLDDSSSEDTPYLYEKTIYENSIIKHEKLKNNPELVCNILPTLNCLDRKKFPVHIIKLINNDYAAVFNDGKIYITNNFKDNIWNGPIENSMPNISVPLRMINTIPFGNMLVGVGYDNKCYIKRSEKILDYTVEWQLMEDIPESIKVIYLMYYFDNIKRKAYKMIINTEGRIMIQNEDGSFRLIDGSYPPLLKVFYNKNGYLLGIDENFRLGSFDDKDWTLSTYGQKLPINNNNFLNDIIYDYDNKLVGITFNFDSNILEFKKQLSVGYENKFILLRKDEKIDTRMTDYQIIISKLGMGNLLGLSKDQITELDNDIEMAYQRQLIEDTATLREFCKSRQDTLNSDFIDLELNNQLSINNDKLDKINNLLNDLSST